MKFDTAAIKAFLLHIITFPIDSFLSASVCFTNVQQYKFSLDTKKIVCLCQIKHV